MYASASWIQHLWDMVLHRTSQIIPKFYPHIHIIITYITYITYIYICWMFLLFNMWIEPIKTWMSDKFTTSYGIFFLQDDVWQAHELQLHKKNNIITHKLDTTSISPQSILQPLLKGFWYDVFSPETQCPLLFKPDLFGECVRRYDTPRSTQ